MLLIDTGDKQHFDEQLLRYMRERNTNKVKEILQNHEPGNLTDSSQSTLLHYAAKHGTTNLVSYLVNAGCNVNAQDELGKTPLILAIEESHEYTVQALLDCDVNLCIKDNEGKSALQLACNTKICRSVKIVEMCVGRVGKQYEGDDEKIAKILIEADCPLYFAVYVKNSAAINIMINHGLSINARDPTTRETALHVAAKLSDAETVNLLVKSHADVNARDFLGKLAFFSIRGRLTDTNEDLEVLKILLDGGLYITADHMRHLAFLDNRFIELFFDYNFDFMARHGDNSTILHFLAAAKSVNFDKLKEKKFDIRARDVYGRTALQVAFVHDNETLVDFLLDNGATIDYPNEDLLRRLTPVEETVGDGARAFYGTRNPKFVKALMTYDEGIDFVLKHQKKIFGYSLKENDNMTKFVLALLAILEVSRTPMSNHILNIIKDNVKFRKLYEKYKKELVVMKGKTLYESITLFDLLIENKNKIEPYVRNQNLLEKYTEMEQDFDSNSYYVNVLQKRVRKAIWISELKKIAVSTFCKLIGVNMDAGYIITDNMFVYLDEIDLKNLVESEF